MNKLRHHNIGNARIPLALIFAVSFTSGVVFGLLYL